MERVQTPALHSRTDLAFSVVVTGIFAAWVMAAAIHHKPWRDEADAWLAVRDMGLRELLYWLGPAGTPGLWYLILMPLPRLGLPYVSMHVLHAGFAITAAALVAFWSPFPRPLKLLIIFSYFLAFEYAVIARSYVLTSVIIFAIALVLRAPVRRYGLLGLLLLLLCNSNVHGLFIAGVIGLVVAIQAARRGTMERGMIGGAALALAGALLSVAQLIPRRPPGGVNSEPSWGVLRASTIDIFFPHVADLLRNHNLRFVLLPLLGISLLIVLAALWSMRRSWSALAIVALSWVCLEYVGVFKWYRGPRHAGLYFLLIVLGLWLGQPAVKMKTAAAGWRTRVLDQASYGVLLFGLLASCVVAATWLARDLRGDYSGASEAAAFIRRNHLSQVPIAAGGGQKGETLLPYLPGTRFWYASLEDFATYTSWDRDLHSGEMMSDDEVTQRTLHRFNGQRHLLLMPSNPLEHPAATGYRLIFQNQHHVWGRIDERYYLYLHEA